MGVPVSSLILIRFKHTPLDASKEQIRLFQLDHNDGKGTIRGSIQIFDKDKAPPYTALSYTWGSAVLPTDIIINGQLFECRSNLLSFLKHYRNMSLQTSKRFATYLRTGSSPSLKTYFWIDALCIDQSNTEERNRLVRSMDRVYSEAEQVLVWLGPCDSADLQHAVRLILSPIARCMDWLNEKLRIGRAFVQLLKFCGLVAPEWRDALVPKKRPALEAKLQKPSCIPAAQAFYKLPYWNRLWIIQELLLARRTRVMMGDVIVPWDWVSSFDREVCTKDLEDRLATDARDSSQLGTLIDNRKKAIKASAATGTTSYIGLRYAIRSFMKSECQDARDRVFGLMGIVNSEERVVVDYEQNELEVLLSASLKLIQACAQDFALQCASQAESERRSSLRLEARSNAPWETIRDLAQVMACVIPEEVLPRLKDAAFNYREELCEFLQTDDATKEDWHYGDDKEFDNYFGPEPGRHEIRSTPAPGTSSSIFAGGGRLEYSGPPIDWANVNNIHFGDLQIPVQEEDGVRFIEIFGQRFQIG